MKTSSSFEQGFASKAGAGKIGDGAHHGGSATCMAKGRVKWFNDAKGFGFIERAGNPYRGSGSGYPFQTLPPTKGSVGKAAKSSLSGNSGKPAPGSGTGAEVGAPDADEIFVHYTAIVGSGHKTLEVGQEVEFDIYESEKGRTAQNVVPRG